VVPADLDHRLDRVGRPQGARQGRRHAEAGHGEGLGQALAKRPGRSGVGVLELLGEGFEISLTGERI
jgi:hypothetical protein